MPATAEPFRPAAGDVARLVGERWGPLLDTANVDVLERYAEGRPLPSRFYRAAADAGLLAFPLPLEAGGEGADARTWGMVLEEIGYRCEEAALPQMLSMHTGIAELLHGTGRTDLAERYVEPISRGECAVALAYSEDTDAFSLRTTLTGAPGAYVLTGHKPYVSGGRVADVFLTYARTPGGDVVALLVERDDPGVELEPRQAVGTRTSGAAAVTFHDVPIPPDRIIAASNGLDHGQRFLNGRRLLVCCGPVGRTRAVLELSAARLTTTARHGQLLASLPNVQAALGRMYIAAQASQATLHQALDHLDSGRADPWFDPIVSAAKHFVVEQARYVLDQALRVLGGHACYGDLRFGMYLRDMASLVAAAGTQELLEINIGAVVASTAPADSEAQR